MTDLRQALRAAVADPPPDELDLVAVMAEGQRSRVRRHRWLVVTIATATASVVVAGASVVALLVRDPGDGGPEPAGPVEPDQSERALDPLGPSRDFAKDPVLGFEADAPLLRDGDVVVGSADDELVGGSFTEDLHVLTSRRSGDGWQFGLVDPAAPEVVDWLPTYPAAESELIPLCGQLVGPRGECVQGRRTLWFYEWVDSGGIVVLQFDRLAREWSEGGRPPHVPQPTASVTAKVVEGRRLEVESLTGSQTVRLDELPLCDRPGAEMLWEDPYDRPRASVEGDVVVLDYDCSVGPWGRAVLDASGRLLMRRQADDRGAVLVADPGHVAYDGMLVDLAAGRLYRLLRAAPRGTGSGGSSDYALVHAIRGGLVLWSEVHLGETPPSTRDAGDRTLHLTPLPGG